MQQTQFHSSSRQTDIQRSAISDKPISMLGPIFGAHVERIGLARVLAGGLSMYLYIPFMIFAHTTFALVIYQGLLRPLLGTPRVHWRDYVIIDRQRIDGLTWFDKFNCMFCGYANGVTTMMNQELDHVSQLKTPVALWRWPLLMVATVLLACIEIIAEVPFQIIFNVMVSLPLGMHHYSISEAHRAMRTHGYGKQLPLVLRAGLYIAKYHTLRFAMALEQIECSWCPLRHFESRKGVVYPGHHEKFFGPKEIRQMYDTLRTRGTVSDRLPRY